MLLLYLSADGATFAPENHTLQQNNNKRSAVAVDIIIVFGQYADALLFPIWFSFKMACVFEAINIFGSFHIVSSQMKLFIGDG